MVRFEVGSKFPLPEVHQEGAQFSVEPYTMMLIYRYDKPTPEETSEFKNGTFQMAVTELNSTLFIATRFGNMGWSDVPYSTQLSDREKILPELGENHLGYALDCFLVDISDGTLVAHRLVRLDQDFSRKFRNLLIDDSAKKFDPALYEKAVAGVYQNYSTRDLLKLALIHMKADK